MSVAPAKKAPSAAPNRSASKSSSASRSTSPPASKAPGSQKTSAPASAKTASPVSAPKAAENAKSTSATAEPKAPRDTVEKASKEQPERAGFSGFLDNVVGGLGSMGEKAQEGLGAVTEAGKAGLGAVADKVGDVVDSGKAGLGAVAEAGKASLGAVADKVGDVVDAGKAGLGAVAGTVSGAFDAGKEAVSDKMQSIGNSLKPLGFSAEEKADGQQAADTMGRLAGTDSTWDKQDLANNFAQIQTGGLLERYAVQGSIFNSHGVPQGDVAGPDGKTTNPRQDILAESKKIRESNPDIARLHKLEGMDPEKVDPAKRQQFDELKSKLTKELSEKGLLPVGVDDLKNMGDSSKLLKEKMKEKGLPEVKEGTPVDVNQFRGMFEGKSPLGVLLGF